MYGRADKHFLPRAVCKEIKRRSRLLNDNVLYDSKRKQALRPVVVAIVFRLDCNVADSSQGLALGHSGEILVRILQQKHAKRRIKSQCGSFVCACICSMSRKVMAEFTQTKAECIANCNVGDSSRQRGQGSEIKTVPRLQHQQRRSQPL